MTKFFAAILVTLSFTIASHAQPNEAERIELAYEVLELSNAAGMSRDAMLLTMPTVRPMIQAQFPSSSPAQIDAGMQVLSDAMLGTIPDVIDASAQIYANRFTADELRAVIEFYETPAGQKFITEQPMLMQEIAQISQQLGAQAAMNASEDLEAALNQ